ncbi:MAG: DUF2179 domain-containing protein [Terrimonas sp.]|nr:DUF2179 domain-containing protein [Terrimonas sp.]
MSFDPRFHQIILQEIKKNLGKTHQHTLSRYEMAKGTWRMRKALLNTLKSILFILLGVFAAGFGLKGFLMPNHFIDGGVMGISLLINNRTGIPLALLIVIINLPFILLARWQIGPVFSGKSILAIIMLSLVIAFFPFPIITNDKLLVAVFGGFFLGAGIGLSIRGGGVIDGTEILAIYLSRKRGLTVGDFIMIFNIIIFGVAAYLLSWEIALYAILTYIAASKTVDFILEGIEEFTGVTIISAHSNEIAEMIQTRMGRGLTIYAGKKGFGKRGENYDSANIIFTVITRLEINKLSIEIEKIDPHAFIVMQSIKDTKGGMVKKRSFK